MNEAKGPDEARQLDDGLFNILDSETAPKLSKQTIDEIHKVDPKSTTAILKIGGKQALPEEYRAHAVDMIKHGIANTMPSMPRRMAAFDEHNPIAPHDIDRLLDSIQHKVTTNASTSDGFHGLSQITHLKNFNEGHSKRVRDLANHAHETYINSKLFDSPNMSRSDVEDIIKHRIKSGSETVSQNHFEAYMQRKDANPEFVKDAMKELLPNYDISNALHQVGYFRHKDMPETEVSNIDSAPYVANNLGHHPKLKSHHLDTLIDSLHQWSEKNRAYPSSSTLGSVLSHPAATPAHFNKVLDHYGKDWMVRDMIQDHPRTPPSVHKRLAANEFASE